MPEAQAEYRLLDLDAERSAAIDMTGDDTIVYTVPPDRNGDPGCDVRLERLLGLLATPPGRFVYLSTTGVYGDHGGGRVDETTPVTPATDRARRRVSAERTLDAWCRSSGTDLVILRVPGIYGPGRLGTERLAAGTSVIAEADAGPGNRIHVADLVSCCVAALSPRAPAGVYNVGDGDERSSTWFSGEVARQAGLPLPQPISLRQAREEWSPMRLSFVAESRRVDVGRMRGVLRPEFEYTDPVAGIAASLAEEQVESKGGR